MPIGAGEGVRGAGIHLSRRRDVERGELRDALGMVEREAMGDTGATVMRADQEALMAEQRHHLRHVERHGALGIGEVLGVGQRLVAVAIAAQIGADEGEAVLQPLRQLVPEHMGLGIAVQQQQRRPLPARPHPDARARGRDVEQPEAGEEAVGDGEIGDGHGRQVRMCNRERVRPFRRNCAQRLLHNPNQWLRHVILGLRRAQTRESQDEHLFPRCSGRARA